MKATWHIHLAGWMKIPWALDEDLRQVQEALGDLVRWTSFSRARIVQAAWPAAIATIPQAALRDKIVVCQADNPPAFYLGTSEFVHAAAVVNLWLARSQEALRQFELLGLPTALAPYTVDSSVFRQTPDREEIRREIGVCDRDFLIGNFHRDSEGADLKRPKMQKGPDILLEIAKRANSLIPNLVVLLAGPRRHWLASALRAEGIRTVFGGPEPREDDDYGRANLSRERLNQLYQAMDCCVVSSRWEGGPYAVLEALAAGCPVISSKVGQARDLLPPECLFSSVEQAVDMLERHARSSILGKICRNAAERASTTHGRASLRSALVAAYQNLPTGSATLKESLCCRWLEVLARLQSKKSPTHPKIEKYHSIIMKRVAENEPAPGLIEFPMNGDQNALIETAVATARARNS
jgi:glycosyltransferase involved in cell wall biosynthesis